MRGLGHLPADLAVVALARGGWSPLPQVLRSLGTRVGTGGSKQRKIHWPTPELGFAGSLLPSLAHVTVFTLKGVWSGPGCSLERNQTKRSHVAP